VNVTEVVAGTIKAEGTANAPATSSAPAFVGVPSIPFYRRSQRGGGAAVKGNMRSPVWSPSGRGDHGDPPADQFGRQARDGCPRRNESPAWLRYRAGVLA
jgi:hypothetical protein